MLHQSKLLFKQKPSTVDEYLALQPGQVRAELKLLRRTIKKAAPKAQEVISYGMPAFEFNGMLAWMAPSKNHYALYVRPRFMQPFLGKLKKYSLSKSAIRFPYGKPLPVKLVTEIIKYAAKENLRNVKKK